MMWWKDSLPGVLEFCENEGQPCESLRQAIEMLKATQTADACPPGWADRVDALLEPAEPYRS